MKITVASSLNSGKRFITFPKSAGVFTKDLVGITLSSDDANDLFETLGLSLGRATGLRPDEPWEASATEPSGTPESNKPQGATEKK